jgi:hypothetical protein
MLTYVLWSSIFADTDEMFWFMCFCGTLLSIFTIPLDIILMPIEIIAFIIYKIIERRNK